MKPRLSIYTRTLVKISGAILIIFMVLALVYGTLYQLSAGLERREELKRNALELSILTENRMDASHTTFTSTDITGHISFAARSTAAFVWIVNAKGEIIYHTGIPVDTMAQLEREQGGGDPLLPDEARNKSQAVYCEGGDQTGLAGLLPGPENWLVASSPLGSHGDLYTGEVLLLKRQQTESLSAFLLEYNVPLSFSLAFLLSLLIIVWLSRDVTRPIAQLAKTANAVYAGDLTARVTMRGEKKALTLEDEGHEGAVARVREDDLTRLVRTFNTLIAKFEEREKQHSEFLANVAHDLRTPVTSIGGFIEGMRDGTIPPDRYPYYLDIIKAESSRLDRLVNDLFADGGQEEAASLKQEVFDLYELVCQVKQSFEPMLADKRLDLEVNFDHRHEAPLRAVGDVDQIRRVLNNIVSNAVRYVPPEGLILIGVEVRDRQILVSVEDSGPGIPSGDLPHIFDRFYKVDKSRGSEGSGLGLYIARALIKRHGQEIEAGKSPNLGGTRIRFTVARP